MGASKGNASRERKTHRNAAVLRKQVAEARVADAPKRKEW